MSHSDDTPVLSPYAPRVDKTPAAVREALDPDWRAEFEAEWRAALEQAKETFDLDPVGLNSAMRRLDPVGLNSAMRRLGVCRVRGTRAGRAGGLRWRW
ncbi:DUF6247 family protein [Carbonactinospora thermoautotrophica]|uniref:DUF6247 family protein n=1 Tax=Carbonactinospora thermoautotrophica TaxID=1469144 RepID=UPI0038B3C3C7